MRHTRRPCSRRAGELLRDRDFDALLPHELRIHSARHFTPVDVARRAARLLVDRPGACILDVGSAVGKFCVVGAGTTDGMFVGVEQRPRLVGIATALAEVLELRNVAFFQADIVEVDWTPFDGFYLFNPFVEYVPSAIQPIDDTLALDPAYYPFYVDFVRERLARARPGTRVVTYHGFGAEPPAGYVLRADEACGSDRLQLWVKAYSARRRPGTDRGRIDPTIQ